MIAAVGRLRELWGKWFVQTPKDLRADFDLDCFCKNVRRFMILPYFNIFTQVSCIFLYLYMYPAVFPERPKLDPFFFLWFTAAYLAVNVAAAVYFHRVRHNPHACFAKVPWSIDVYVLCYVVLEASQVSFELEISGNLYRFLATFFVVSFFPVLTRPKRVTYMVLYVVISELWLLYLRNVHSVSVYSYPEIVIVFFLACLIATNIAHNNTINNYILHVSLLEKNKQLSELNEKLEQLSVTDSLTELANRRALGDYAATCWKNSVRTGSQVSIIMVDIDCFKSYNDTYGHQMGDECLRKVACCIGEAFHRDTDMTARYGGEEFAILLPHTSLDSGVILAERLRKAVEDLHILHQGNPQYGCVTISAGVAGEIPRPGDSYERLMKQADDALYQAKAEGRNRVCATREAAVS